jgi:GLPGLI family protein
MKKLITILLLSTSAFLFSQQSGIVEYSYSFHPEKIKSNLNKLENAPKMKVTAFMKMTEAYAKQHQYILKFNKNEASFEVIEGMKPDDLMDPSGWRISQWTFGKGSFYQNAQKRYQLNLKKSMGKLYLIKDSIISDWTISYESRIIGGYKCYKATKKGIGKKFDVVAWFTPEIPLPFGPSRFNGTPGLILELSYGPHTLTMKKIRFKSNVSIKKPNEGILISQEDYDVKTLEFRHSLYNRRRK